MHTNQLRPCRKDTAVLTFMKFHLPGKHSWRNAGVRLAHSWRLGFFSSRVTFAKGEVLPFSLHVRDAINRLLPLTDGTEAQVLSRSLVKEV